MGDTGIVNSKINGKKILYLIGSKDPGGAERVVLELARNFQGKGNQVLVGHLGNPWLKNELQRSGIEEICFPFAHLYSSHKTEWIFILHLMKFIRTRGFDFIHAHLFGMNLYATIAGRILRVPVLGTIHDKYYFTEKEHRKLAYKVMQMMGCKLVAVSEDIRENLCSGWGMKRNGVRTIYNGIDSAVFETPLDRKAKREELGLGEEDIVVISVGRLVPIKGHSSLIGVGSQVFRHNGKIKFVIVGDGPERKGLERMSVSEGISRSVIFTGHREDVPELLRMSDIFVQTSFSEGHSCTIAEALAAGCPVIATNVGGNKEMVTSGKEGYLVAIQERTLLGEKILDLAHDQSLRMELSEKGKETAKKFSLKAMIENYERVYLTLDSSYREN